MSKKDENIKQCTKCECLFFAEKPRQQSQARDKRTPEGHQSFVDDDESSDGIVITPTCHETVKIFVRSPCGKEFYNDKRNGNSLAEVAPNKVEKKPDENPPKTQDVNTEEGKAVPFPDSDKNKRNCFRFCRKKKKTEDSRTVSKPTNLQDCNTQTCQAVLNSTKTQSSDTNVGEGSKNSAPEMDIAEIIKNCRTCPSCARQGSGGCNTNTIIFPRDKSGGDGLTCLENWLRLEAKTNTRNFEDVLSELHKVKRDIHELKDMIETVSRAVREQLFMAAYGKGKSEIIDDLNRQKNLERKMNPKAETADNKNHQRYLERKTNTLSLTDAAINESSGKNPKITRTVTGTNSAAANTSHLFKSPVNEDVIKVTNYTQVNAPPLVEEETKKKRFFPWCK